MRLSDAFPFAIATRTLVVLAAGVSLGGLPRVAHSQTQPQIQVPENTLPLTNGAPADADVANQAMQMAGGQTAGAYGGYNQVPRLGADAMARPQLQTRQLTVEARMRDLMTRNGITTTSTQDAILTFMRQDEDNKRVVREASKRLWNGVRRDVPIERLRSLMGDYQKSLATAHDNRVRAQTALDARVGYSLDARLEAMLWLLGVLGEGQNVIMVNLPAPAPAPAPTLPDRATRLAENPLVQPFGQPRITMAIPAITTEVQITGIVNNKNAPQEVPVWLEIRDANGRLWRMVPSNNPDAQPILNRQIDGLGLGARVLVRLVSPPIVTPTTPYTLLALSTMEGADQREEGGEKGAPPAPDGQ